MKKEYLGTFALLSILLLGLAALPVAAGKVKRIPARFSNGDLQLQGTLWRPKAEGPIPAVIVVHGSGPETRGSLKHFARAFASHGVATLLYDKRGTGASQGDPEAWRYFDFDDLAGDAAAGVRWLAQLPEIDSERIGVVGVSQGGWVAPMVAARNDVEVAFLVLVSAAATSVAEDRIFERGARLALEGFDPDEVAEARAMQVVDQEVTRSGKRWQEFQELWRRNRSKRWFPRVYLSDQPIPPEDEYRLWYRKILDRDSLPLLQSSPVPTLWLMGDPALDRFAPVAQTVEIVEGLQAAGQDHELVVFEGADHSLQRVVNGKRRGSAPWQGALYRWLDEHVSSGSER